MKWENVVKNKEKGIDRECWTISLHMKRKPDVVIQKDIENIMDETYKQCGVFKENENKMNTYT